jgi:hypothetical protein
MKALILLKKDHQMFGDLQAALRDEMGSLVAEGITVEETLSAPPEDTLVLGEVAEFLVENKDTIVNVLPFLTAVIQVVRAVLDRKKITRKKAPAGAKKRPTTRKKGVAAKWKNAAVIVNVNGDLLELPCTDTRARSYVKKVSSKIKTPKQKK